MWKLQGLLRAQMPFWAVGTTSFATETAGKMVHSLVGLKHSCYATRMLDVIQIFDKLLA